MSGRRVARIAACAAVALASTATLAACGGSSGGPSSDEVARIKAEARHQALVEMRTRDAMRETRRLQREVDRLRDRNDGGSSSSSSGQVSSGSSTAGGSTTCDPGLTVNSVTSCPFARNVRSTYESSGGASSIDVYSPVTGQTYRMSCSGGIPVVCTGGNGAAVYIR
jgi:hypothetical protein